MIRSKKEWDAVDRRSFFAEVYRVADSGTLDEKRTKYAELGYVLENEETPLLASHAQFERWSATINALHTAFYGLPPGMLTTAQICQVLPVDEETVARVSAALDGLLEAHDGASLKQLVRAAQKELKSAGVKLSPRLLTRLIAAFDGFPIPPA